MDIREAEVRRWRKERLDAGPHADRPFGPVTVAKAYRVLHAMLATAADDKLISRNPCRIKGAGEEHSPERPVLPLPSFLRLLDCVPPRYRAMLLLATFASLRFGELAALRRSDLDLNGCVVRVVRSTAQMNGGSSSRNLSRAPVAGLCRSRRRSWVSCGGTWSVSQCPAPRAWSSSVRRVVGCEDQISAICGSLPLRTPASQTCTFTIFATPATRWRRLPALVCAS
jgi:hypothetical protein